MDAEWVEAAVMESAPLFSSNLPTAHYPGNSYIMRPSFLIYNARYPARLVYEISETAKTQLMLRAKPNIEDLAFNTTVTQPRNHHKNKTATDTCDRAII